MERRFLWLVYTSSLLHFCTTFGTLKNCGLVCDLGRVDPDLRLRSGRDRRMGIQGSFGGCRCAGGSHVCFFVNTMPPHCDHIAYERGIAMSMVGRRSGLEDDAIVDIYLSSH